MWWAFEQKAFNVYATATLSGDVANAIELLKRMARPSSRRHKAGLLIPTKELASCQVSAPAVACCLSCSYFYLGLHEV